MTLKIFLLALSFSVSVHLIAQKLKTYKVSSIDGTIECTVSTGSRLTWSLTSQGQTILAPSVINMELQNGEVLGKNMQIKSTKTTLVNAKIPALMYKKDTVVNNYNQLTITCKGDYGITFRAYNDGVSYRFFTSRKDSVFV